MTMKQVIKHMQGGGFADPRKPIPSPFPTSRRLVQPTLDNRDRMLLETVHRLNRLRKRKEMTEDVKFRSMVG